MNECIRTAITPILSVAILTSFGCQFAGLAEDVRILESTAAIEGRVETSFTSDQPVYIALFNKSPGRGLRQQTYALRYGSGRFEFIVESGTYVLAAFEDLNGDLRLQSNEQVGWHGSPTPVYVPPSGRLNNLTIRLREPEDARAILPGIYAPAQTSLGSGRPPYPLAEVVSLNDPRFAADVGQMGLWEPVKFFQRGLGGLFFLQPYDAKKIPVLFVHGIGGSASEFATLINSLDTQRYQPWILQYPSGIRLDMVADGIAQGVLQLQVRLGFEHVVVVAHSMGGLVARGFIDRYEARKDESLVPLFITMSTPWGGHSFARMGVDYAPVVVPSWNDMVPGSPYLTSLTERRLPEGTDHYLLFSHRGAFNVMANGNADGVVTLKSQLLGAAQQTAVRVMGYDTDHAGILRSAAVARDIQAILADYADSLAPQSAL